MKASQFFETSVSVEPATQSNVCRRLGSSATLLIELEAFL
jgi:hypothetical protein